MYSYSESSDIYFIEENQKEETILPGYARVTEILSPWTNFDSIPPDVLRNAADRGTRVHAHCEHYANLAQLYACGMFDMSSVESDCLPYVLSYTQWFDENVEEVYLQEERIYCDEHLFCGKPDCIVRLKNDKPGHLTIIDIKTPQSPSLSWMLQLGAYQYLVETYKPEYTISRRGALMLKKTGSEAKFVEYTDPNHITMFLDAAKLYRFFNTKKGKK